jgi:SAM-dependent methyltransferase
MTGDSGAPRSLTGDLDPAGPAAEPVGSLLDRWRSDLADWAIPDHITATVPDSSPWVLPREVFARRADRVTAAPSGPSFDQALAALDPPGSVLDVGCGAGAACLPLLARCRALTVVDTEADMLDLVAGRAIAAGIDPRRVQGRWPDVAPLAGVADVVTCHHVTYNVAEIEPFLRALTAAARRTVIVEMTARHPLTTLNDLWLRFHGLARPARPTADDLLAILTGLGISARHQRWTRPGGRDYGSLAELADVTRRRLCLPADRADDVARALIESGTDPDHPLELGSAGREVFTIFWDGGA